MQGSITQRLNFADASTALLRIESDKAEDLLLTGSQWGKNVTVTVEQNSVIARHPSGESVTVTFTPDVTLSRTENNYTALVHSPRYPVHVAISFFTSEKEMTAGLQNIPTLLNNPGKALQANAERWEGYLTKILRKGHEARIRPYRRESRHHPYFQLAHASRRTASRRYCPEPRRRLLCGFLGMGQLAFQCRNR